MGSKMGSIEIAASVGMGSKIGSTETIVSVGRAGNSVRTGTTGAIRSEISAGRSVATGRTRVASEVALTVTVMLGNRAPELSKPGTTTIVPAGEAAVSTPVPIATGVMMLVIVVVVVLAKRASLASLMTGAALMVPTAGAVPVPRTKVGATTISTSVVVLGNRGRSVPMGRTAVASPVPAGAVPTMPVPSTMVSTGTMEETPVPIMPVPMMMAPVPMGATAVAISEVLLANGALMGATERVGAIVPMASPVPVTRMTVGVIAVTLGKMGSSEKVMGRPVPTEATPVPIRVGSIVTVRPMVLVRLTVVLITAETLASIGLEIPVGMMTTTGTSVPGRGAAIVPLAIGKGASVAVGRTSTGPVTRGAVTRGAVKMPVGRAMTTSVELASKGGTTTTTGASLVSGRSSEANSEGSEGSSVGKRSMAVVIGKMGRIDIISSVVVAGSAVGMTTTGSVILAMSLITLAMALITLIGVLEAPGVGTTMMVGSLLSSEGTLPNSFLKKSVKTCHPL